MKTGVCPFSQEWNLTFHVSSVHFLPYMLFLHSKATNISRYPTRLGSGLFCFQAHHLSQNQSHSALCHERLSPPNLGSNKSLLLIAILNHADFNRPHVIQTDFCPTRALDVSGLRFHLWPLTGWSLWRPTLSSLCSVLWLLSSSFLMHLVVVFGVFLSY